MTLQVLYNTATCEVLQGQDTAKFHYVEPALGFAVGTVTEAEYPGDGSPQARVFYVAGAVTATDPNTPTLEVREAQGLKRGELNTAYQAASTAPIAFTTAGGVAQTFQADAKSQNTLAQQLAVYVTAGAALPSGYSWTAADNTQVPFTVGDLKGLATAIGDRGAAAFFNLQQKKAAVRAATSLAEVNAVAW